MELTGRRFRWDGRREACRADLDARVSQNDGRKEDSCEGTTLGTSHTCECFGLLFSPVPQPLLLTSDACWDRGEPFPRVSPQNADFHLWLALPCVCWPEWGRARTPGRSQTLVDTLLLGGSSDRHSAQLFLGS